jgi:hypothetical protein
MKVATSASSELSYSGCGSRRWFPDSECFRPEMIYIYRKYTLGGTEPAAYIADLIFPHGETCGDENVISK